MAKNVFISFRFSDGNVYKEEMVKWFDSCEDTVDCSEDEDRSGQSEETIRKYLYAKLKRSSVTIVLLTPNAIKHQRNRYNKIDDWMYDEIRYSLEDRDGNRTNGLIAVYTPEAESMLITKSTHICDVCNKETPITIVKRVNNLFRENMMNVKLEYKKNKCENIYDSDYDSYCSLVSFEDFKKNLGTYIDIATEKRENKDHYKLKVHLQ